MSGFIFASMGVRNDIIREKLSSKLDTSKRVLIIPCAASNEELTAKTEKEAFGKLGFDRNKIYAFDITKPNKYFGIRFDYIYIPGGNQYKLLSEIREHEIDKKIIMPCLEKGAAYIGISALGLVEFNIICHYNNYGNEIYDQVKARSDSKKVITIEDDMIFEF